MPKTEYQLGTIMKHLSIKIMIAITFCTTLFITGIAIAGDAATQATASDKSTVKKVAIVNDVPILQSDFDAEFNQIKNRFMQKGQTIPPAQIDTAKNEVLDNLIDQELLNQESVKRGITVSDAEISDSLAKVKEKFPSEAEFNKMLDAMNLSSEGVSEKIKRSIAINKLVERDLVQKISVTEEETKGFYDGNPTSFAQPKQVKASHILVKVDAQADKTEKENAKKKITSIQQKITKGEDFAELAKGSSDCPSGAKGGDLGFFGAGSMVKPFEEAAFSMKPGEISDIVETQFGYHLIKVTDQKEAQQVSYQEAKGNITKYLKRKKTEDEVKTLITALKKDAKIEKHL